MECARDVATLQSCANGLLARIRVRFGRSLAWFGVLGSGFWFWVLGSGFWVLGSGFWVLECHQMFPSSAIRCLMVAAVLAASCREAPPRAGEPAVVWRHLGAWSGHGSMQTDAFISDTGSMRLRWETRNESAPGQGFFRLTVHSDVSGRSLVEAVDVRGVGAATTYVTEDPRPFFLAVESANLDWSVVAEEAVAATLNRGRAGGPDNH
jgi:hypothetical protein